MDSSYDNVSSVLESNGTEMAGADWWRERVQVVPDWTKLFAELRWTWQLHTYGIACLFLVLACASFFTILGLRAQLSARPHLSSLNVFLCLLGTARAFGLFIDPYGSKETMPLVMSSILWDLGYPCLLSAFALLQLSFLRMTQIKMAPSRLSNETTVSIIITSHFCLIIASDILWALKNSLRIVWLLTQVAFVLWGLFLCLTFLCGCLRLLRSIVKLPLLFLSQIDSAGYENKGVLPLGMFSKRELPASDNRLGNSLHIALGPKIRITDVNDQTFSYVSDSSQPALAEPRSTEGAIPSRSLQIPESSRNPWTQRTVNNQITSTSTHEDLGLTRPLMGDRDGGNTNSVAEDQGEQGPMLPHLQSGPATISSLQKGGAFLQQTIRVPAQLAAADDFKFDAHKLKPSRRSRVEKLLRRLVVTSVFGLLLCLLKAYGVFGPHGLSSGRRNAAAVPWFCYQTLCRIVEFVMGCSMASITRQSLHSHCYHYCGGTIKHRDPFFT